MKITFGQLKQLEVVTESGNSLGNVVDLQIDADSHEVKKYVVSNGKLIKRQEYLIASEQVVEITENEMVVNDSVIKQGVAEGVRQEVSTSESAGINFKTE